MASLLVEKTDSLKIQAFRYLFVGVIATIADMGTLYVLKNHLHLHYLLSAAFSFVFGLVTNYLLSIKWVFASRTLKNRTAEFTVFAIIGAAGLGLTELIMFMGVELMHMHYMASKLMAVFIVFAWNFGMRRLILFGRKAGA